MIKKLYLLAVWDSESNSLHHQKFFERLADSFSAICRIELLDVRHEVLENVLAKKNYDGLLAFSSMDADLPSFIFSEKPIHGNNVVYISNLSEAFINPESILLISNRLFLFLSQLQKTLLEHLPYNLSIYDENNRLDYSNHKADNEFSIESQPKEAIDDWIVDEVKKSASHSFTLTIPTMTSEKMLIQHFQGLYDENKRYQGIVENVLDLKPILKNYLNETGQAIVPWSDVTSGASIKNDDFDL
ncbi:hypothetical protein [Streptococcus pacificus]|uniref:Uncharacterized protein n=1 Tax=Streptococcus pacificus TaxID=2740577 RepID=A0ABS0ZHM4_9STRE|nr:hypothetical protein [Streptococcus pacificus]MBJ8325495.1 hypothetical protein [Streptococcus pacificus]